MYAKKDVSIVIPTYNRSEDIKVTLNFINKYCKGVKEIIVVDQSKDNSTKNVILKMKKSNIKYVFSKTPSITIARNIGVSKVSKQSKIVYFIDDDVSISSSCVDEILRVFNENKDALGVAGFNKPEFESSMNIIEHIARKFFVISHNEKDKARILSAYCNTYPLELNKTIKSEWLPGVNMAYKKEVFNYQKFDENLLGYTLCEDIDFTYRLFKRFPGSLYITPFAKLKHRISNIERPATERISYINQIDHFYFFYKNIENGIFSKIKFVWTLIGISFLRILELFVKPKRQSFLKTKYYYTSLFYCLKNLKKIKSGKLREFVVK